MTPLWRRPVACGSTSASTGTRGGAGRLEQASQPDAVMFGMRSSSRRHAFVSSASRRGRNLMPCAGHAAPSRQRLIELHAA